MFVPQSINQFRNSNADVRMYFGSGKTTFGPNRGAFEKRSWNKPVGVSHVYILLLGGGSSSSTTNGGAGGAITVWYGAAQNVPDVLQLNIGGNTNATGGQDTWINVLGSSTTEILSANGANTAQAGGAAMTANFFTASGFFQSVAGPNGNGGATPPATTFNTGGNSSGVTTGAYGYTTGAASGQGIFLLQPMLVAVGFSQNDANAISAPGCGADQAWGGTGFALIASW